MDVSAVVDCNGLWADFDITAEAIEAEEAVDDKQPGRATLAIAALLLYKSFARSGAVCNATVPEFKAVKQVRGEGPGGSDVFVFAVREHKTGTLGTAKLTMGEEDFERVSKYLLVIRPEIDPDETLPHLLVLPGPKQLDHLHRRIQRMCDRYNLDPPSATCARQAAAMQVQLQRGHAEVSLVTNGLCHTSAVSSRYYEATVGNRFSALVWNVIECILD